MNIKNDDKKEYLISSNSDISYQSNLIKTQFNLNDCLELISEKPIYQLRTLIMLLLTWGYVPIVAMLPFFFNEVPYLCSKREISEPYKPCTAETICNTDYSKLIDSSHFNEITWSRDFKLVCDRAFLKYLISSAYFIGMMVSSLITPTLCDRYGKKYVLTLNMSLFVLNYIFVLMISDGVYLILLTFVSGYIYTGISIPAFVLNYEFYTTKTKNILSSLIGCSFPIGALLQILTFYLFRNWRYNIIVGLGLYLVLLYFSKLIYESPNYLIRLSKKDDLMNCLYGVARANSSLSKLENYLNSVTFDNVFKITTKEENTKKNTLCDIFKDHDSRLKILLISTSWFTCSIIAWGNMMNIKNYGTDIYFNSLCMYIGACLSAAVSSQLLNKFGNNKTEIFFYTITLIANLGLIISTNDMTKSLFVFLSSFSTFAIGSTNYLYTAELFISEIRVHALATGSLCNRIGGFLSPFVVGYFTKPTYIFCILCLLSIASLLLLNKNFKQN
jgi:MFS family permease